MADKNKKTVIVDGKEYTWEEHIRNKHEFFPPEGGDFDLLKQPSSLTEEDKKNLTEKQKLLYDTKEPAEYRNKK